MISNIEFNDHEKSRELVYNYVDFMSGDVAIYVGKGSLLRVLDRSPRNLKHVRVINKYDIVRKVVYSTPRQRNDDCLKNERQLIADLKTYYKDSYFGCNFTKGGEGTLGLVHSDETKARISKSVRASGFIWSNVDKQRMSLQRKGRSRRPWTMTERQMLSQLAMQREPYVDGVREFIPCSARTVIQRSGNEIKTFSSLSVAARSVLGQRNALRNAIVKRIQYKGYYWEYAMTRGSAIEH